MKRLAERQAKGEAGLPIECKRCGRVVCGSECMAVHNRQGKVCMCIHATSSCLP